MKVLTAIAGSAVAAALLSAAPAKAQFFDAPAAIAGGILGATAGAIGTAAGFGNPYYGAGYGYGYPSSYYGDGYSTGYYGAGYAPAYSYGYQSDPYYSGRTVYSPRSYRQYRRSFDNPYN